MKIVILDAYTINPGDMSWERFEQFGELVAYDRTPDDLVIPRIQDAEIVFTDKTVIDRQVIDQCPRLRWIGVLATGYNVVDTVYAREKGIPVTNIPAYSTASVSQHAFALLLSLCNHVERHAQLVDSGTWSACPDFCFWDQPLIQLSGKTMGIIGFGSIGRQMAHIAMAFGMKVLVSTGYPDPSLEGDSLRFVDQDTLLSQSDVISLHCPLTEKNKQLIDRSTIRKMKQGAMLINTARGGLIHEADLAEALRSGRLSGAGLDVLSSEPPSMDNPLIGLPNCIITPHIAWSSMESRLRLCEVAVQNLASYLAGGHLNEVN